MAASFSNSGDDGLKNAIRINAYFNRTIMPIAIPLPKENEIRPLPTWGYICQTLIENSFNRDAALMLQIFSQLSPSKRFKHYLIHYGDENATLFCVEWSSSNIPGFVRVPLVEGCAELNMTLVPKGGGSLQSSAEPHLPLQLDDRKSSIDVDICVTLAAIHSSSQIKRASDQIIFASDIAHTSVARVQEHGIYPGVLNSMHVAPANDDTNDLLPDSIRFTNKSNESKQRKKKKKKKQKKQKKKVKGRKRKCTKSKVDGSTDAKMKGKKAKLNAHIPSDDGSLQSFVDPNFHLNHPGVLEAGYKILDDLYTHRSHAPWVEGPGIVLAAESAYGNKPKINLHRHHYMRQSFAKTDYSQPTGDDTTRVCFVYGAGKGQVTFGTKPDQVAYRSWNNEMQIIASAIEKELVKVFSVDSNVDVSDCLNEVEIVSFYNDKRITYHRDQTYKDGKFVDDNCQKQHTCTCIFVIGDPRDLEFQLHLGKKILNRPKAYKKITLTNGALFFLHPQDEEDRVREIFKMKHRTHFKHRNNGVKGDNDKLSVGLVFRTCTKTKTVLKTTGQLVDPNITQATEVCRIKLKRYIQSVMKRVTDNRLKTLYVSMKSRHLPNSHFRGQET